MTSITLWLLIATASGHRPAVVIERFHSEAQCLQAKSSYASAGKEAGGQQYPICLRVEAAR